MKKSPTPKSAMAAASKAAPIWKTDTARTAASKQALTGANVPMRRTPAWHETKNAGRSLSTDCGVTMTDRQQQPREATNG